MSDPAFRAETLVMDDEVILRLSGDIDMLSAPNFAAASIHLDGAAARIVFDMAEVTFMDSAGLSVLAGTMRRLERTGGSLRLRRPSRQVRQILTISGLDQLLTIEESLSAARVAVPST